MPDTVTLSAYSAAAAAINGNDAKATCLNGRGIGWVTRSYGGKYGGI